MSATRKTTVKPEDNATDTVFGATNNAQASLNEGVERMTKGMSQMGAIAQENTEAVMQAASVFAKGYEKIAQEGAEFAKSQLEVGQERMQSLTKAKTPQEFFEAQSDLMKTAMEAQISQANKVSDMLISTAKDAAQPLSKRYSAIVELMQQR